MSVGGSKLRPEEYHSVVVANRMRRHLVFGRLVIRVEFFSDVGLIAPLVCQLVGRN